VSATVWRRDLLYSLRHPWVRAASWACAAAAALALAAVVFWLPLSQAQAALENEIAAKRREFVHTERAEELLRAYERARKEVVLLEKKLEHAATQAQLVENIGRLARKHGVRLRGESYEEGRSAGAQPTLTAELTVQGGYRALRGFMRDFATLPTWSEVQEVRLEKERKSTTVRGRIRVVTYRGVAADGKSS